MEIIYEDKNFIAVNKPAGILVHQVVSGKAKSSGEETVVDWVLERYPNISSVGDNSKERPGIVHRLDKDTSGVVIIARNQPFFEHLKSLFQSHQVRKVYLALVWGILHGTGIIDKPIGLKSGTTKRSVVAKNMKMVKEAITEYKPIESFSHDREEFTLVRLIPKTGRTHQLRVHMASINHPVVGDPLYGRKSNPWNLNRQFLHAESIEFSGQDGERFCLEAELPRDLAEILTELKNKQEVDRNR